MPWWHARCHTTLPRKWKHSSGNNCNCKSPYDTKEIFSPLIVYFISSIFPVYFTLKIAAQISGGTMWVRKAFYLVSASTICTSHYAPDMPGNWNDLKKGASGKSQGIMWQPVKLQWHFCASQWVIHRLLTSKLTHLLFHIFGKNIWRKLYAVTCVYNVGYNDIK